MRNVLLRLEDVAVRLGVSYNTIRSFIDDGKLQTTKVGRSIRVSEDDLGKFIQQTEDRPPPAETSN